MLGDNNHYHYKLNFNLKEAASDIDYYFVVKFIIYHDLINEEPVNFQKYIVRINSVVKEATSIYPCADNTGKNYSISLFSIIKMKLKEVDGDPLRLNNMIFEL